MSTPAHPHRRPRKPKSVRKEVFYPYAPERVWVALTDPRALAEWLMPNTFEAKVGHRFQFRYDGGRGCGPGVTSCEVLELDPPRRMVWSWLNHTAVEAPMDKAPMRIAWTLIPERGGTRLVLDHTGLENERWIIGLMMNFGWGHMMKRLLAKVLRNISDAPGLAFTPGAIPLAKRCYRAKTVPPEFIR